MGLTFTVLADTEQDFFPIWDPNITLPMAYIIDQNGVVTWKEASGTGALDEMRAEILSLMDD